jgi:acetylornithine deacetylase
MSYVESIERWIEMNRDYILQTLSEFIQIKTDNIPPEGFEKPGQEYLYNKSVEFLSEDDLDMFEVDDVKGIRKHPLFFSEIDGMERVYKNRPNLVAKIKGSGNGRSLVFSGHTDTVPVMEKKWSVFEDPYSGKMKEGRMYGRGAADDKGGTLCCFLALKCLKEIGVELKGDVFAESVVDEEYGGVNGTIACRLRYPAIDFAILAEPSGLSVTIETAGGSIWKAIVEEKGPGGYSQTVNPIFKLSELISALRKYSSKRYDGSIYSHDYKGERDLMLWLFLVHAGGRNYLENASYVPKHGCVYFYLPTLAGWEEGDVRDDFINFMKQELSKYEDFRDDFPRFSTILRWLGAHKTDTGHSAMSSIKKSYQQLGIKYEEKALSLPCDAFAFKETSGTEVVIIGPRGGNYHGTDEYVEIDSVFDVIKIMALSAIHYCS